MFPTDVVDLLEAQLGVISRFQMREHLTAAEIGQHVRTGRLRRVARGVYRVAGGAVLPDQIPQTGTGRRPRAGCPWFPAMPGNHRQRAGQPLWRPALPGGTREVTVEVGPTGPRRGQSVGMRS
jgi:hypothetical protein